MKVELHLTDTEIYAALAELSDIGGDWARTIETALEDALSDKISDVDEQTFLFQILSYSSEGGEPYLITIPVPETMTKDAFQKVILEYTATLSDWSYGGNHQVYINGELVTEFTK